MASENPPVNITIRLSGADAIAFLERLETNEAFRSEYERNPRAVLSEYGIDIEPSEAVPPQAKAPPKEDIRRAIDELMKQREAMALAPFPGWWPFAPFLGLLSFPETGGPEQEA